VSGVCLLVPTAGVLSVLSLFGHDGDHSILFLQSGGSPVAAITSDYFTRVETGKDLAEHNGA
jgi:hypothetical protein